MKKQSEKVGCVCRVCGQFLEYPFSIKFLGFEIGDKRKKHFDKEHPTLWAGLGW